MALYLTPFGTAIDTLPVLLRFRNARAARLRAIIHEPQDDRREEWRDMVMPLRRQIADLDEAIEDAGGPVAAPDAEQWVPLPEDAAPDADDE